ncbi:MAG: MBL fold metallo-hydrolase [Polyangiaceae bacterium]|jgi:metallo-beta-lactamase family protein|nr:MBL fold metallo-hydrolase [Polyangiaceae bacterium]
MEIEFLGAAQTVTGSMHLLHTKHARILLDCGLFQGHRRESFERNRHLPFRPRDLDAVVLSHAHIDHSGALPMLARGQFRGSIFATPATRDLCAAMLDDAAMIQQADARFINKMIDREGSDMEPVEPLYEQEDVLRALSRTISIPYHHTMTIAPGVRLTFYDAGHVLGSAITALDIDEDGQQKRVVFTGDLGRRGTPILRDPEVPDDTTLLITESTYGDRTHAPRAEVEERLARVINETYQRGGKVIIPAFALERAQELLYAISYLRRNNLIPRIPVVVDSPLTVKVTDIFKLHPECYDQETRARLFSGDNPFEFAELDYISKKEDSKKISTDNEPMVILSASGMCEAGRILHHLKATIENERNSILIVGYQAQHTLGRRIVERRPRVKIFGVERDLKAQVHVLNGFSAHADQGNLIEYARASGRSGKLRQIALVHGEPRAQDVLQKKMLDGGLPPVAVPAPGQRITH